jgi:Fe-S cluster assembly protein SufD
MSEKFTIKVKENEEKVVPIIITDPQQGTDVSVDVQLVGRGARVKLLGLFIHNNYQSVFFKVNVIHKAADTQSRVDIRAVLYDHANFDNDGLIRINHGAKNADGFYCSKVLLFDDAKGRSVPSLEIDENELKAGHASSVGRPREEELFYLRSRGLSQKEAEKLIVSGFFEPILAQLPEGEREKVKNKLHEKL